MQAVLWTLEFAIKQRVQKHYGLIWSDIFIVFQDITRQRNFNDLRDPWYELYWIGHKVAGYLMLSPIKCYHCPCTTESLRGQLRIIFIYLLRVRNLCWQSSTLPVLRLVQDEDWTKHSLAMVGIDPVSVIINIINMYYLHCYSKTTIIIIMWSRPYTKRYKFIRSRN